MVESEKKSMGTDLLGGISSLGTVDKEETYYLPDIFICKYSYMQFKHRLY